jgi:hypothetical protein
MWIGTARHLHGDKDVTSMGDGNPSISAEMLLSYFQFFDRAQSFGTLIEGNLAVKSLSKLVRLYVSSVNIVH